MLDHIAAVRVITAVGNHQTQFVQARCPTEHARIIRIQFPGIGDLLEQTLRSGFHAFGLDCIDAVAQGECGDRFIAQVVVAGAAHDVVEDAFTHRRFADQQLLQAQGLEGGLQHQHAAGDDRAALAGQRG
ncbi:hypothetical protein D3C81_1207710 [compost metagenome]